MSFSPIKSYSAAHESLFIIFNYFWFLFNIKNDDIGLSVPGLNCCSISSLSDSILEIAVFFAHRGWKYWIPQFCFFFFSGRNLQVELFISPLHVFLTPGPEWLPNPFETFVRGGMFFNTMSVARYENAILPQRSCTVYRTTQMLMRQ